MSFDSSGWKTGRFSGKILRNEFIVSIYSTLRPSIRIKKTTMLNNMRAKRLNGLHLTGTSLGPMARLPPKYSDEDWDFNNKVKLRITCDQERMAERIME